MTLLDPNQLVNIPHSHGMKPWSYRVEFGEEKPPSLFQGDPVTEWNRVDVELQSVQVGHGVGPFSAQMTMFDRQTVDFRRVSDMSSSTLIEPKNGMQVRIWHTDMSVTGFPNQGRYIFTGIIRNVHTDTNAEGTLYIVQATSNAWRLNEARINFTANLLNDPLNPSPRFDAQGNLVMSRLKTVYELVQDVMNFQDAWNSRQYFKFTDIEWGGLDIDPRCGLFVPPGVNFSSIPKGTAIESLLQMAGNFHFIHITLPDGSEKLRIVEHNLSCDNCGDKWTLPWPSTQSSGPYTYAFTQKIKEDSTVWSSEESANVCRITSGQIWFYSGTSIIPEIFDDPSDHPDLGNPLTRNCITVDNDTADMQKERARGPDWACYRFTMPANTSQDNRRVKQFYVGMPLFPDWNPHEDFQPAPFTIGTVRFPDGMDTIKSKKPSDYMNLIEWQQWTIGDAVARKDADQAHLNNLKVYQAWYCKDKCPACDGSGLVAKVYKSDDNEPEYKYYYVAPSGQGKQTVELNDTTVPPSGVRIIPKVTNYIFNPAQFGTGVEPSGLVPFASGTAYPLPWKNMCPYCRGTGMKPEYRIRNIQQTLFSGRSTAVPTPAASGISGGEIYIDPDKVQTGPETWEQSNNRIAKVQPPLIQMEVALLGTQKIFLPTFENRDWSWARLKGLGESNRRNRFPHPLNFKKLRKRTSMFQGVPATQANAKIVPDDWTCLVPFTTIDNMTVPPHTIDNQMGQVIFEDPVFIPCNKPMAGYLDASGSNLYQVDSDGMLVSRSPGRGQRFVDAYGMPTGFWRAPRVWMTFNYVRSLYYNYLYKDPKGNNIDYAEFQAKDPEGNLNWYQARASIHDGRLAVEVIKKWPSPTEAGGTEYPTGNRAIQVTTEDEDLIVQTTESDLYKLAVPPTVNDDYHALEVLKKGYDLDHVRGRVYQFVRTTPGEVFMEMEGYDSVDYDNSIVRPRIFSFSLRDNRPKMLSRAVRILENQNDLTVSGKVSIQGESHDFSNGLGWVDHPRARAHIETMDYTYGDQFNVTITLRREQARYGETLPKDNERMNNIESMVYRMLRSQRAFQSSQGIRVNNVSQADGQGVQAAPVGLLG